MYEIASKLFSSSGLATLVLLSACSQPPQDAINPPPSVSPSPSAVLSQATSPLTPPSTAISFVSDRTGETELYRINLDESGLTKLTVKSGIEQAHSWSPDGSQVCLLKQQRRSIRHYHNEC